MNEKDCLDPAYGLESLILQSLRPSDHARTVVLGEVVCGVVCAGCEEEVFDDPFGSFFGCFYYYCLCQWCVVVGRIVGEVRGDKPGVFINRLCGIWNCIVLGGLGPPTKSISSSSKSSSLSQTGFLPLAGVKTLIPGLGVVRERGPLGRRLRLMFGVSGSPLTGEKISALSCGASSSGLESGESKLKRDDDDVVCFGVTVNLGLLP